jgi:hypothetical protein
MWGSWSAYEFSDAIVNQKIYDRPRIARYVLIALEEAFKHKEVVDTTSATIEHVMPQTLSDEWKLAIQGDYTAIHDRWSDTLGNLTLTSYNSELGNMPFEEKKNLLKNTHFELTRWINSHEVWDASEIETRGRFLSEMALVRWSRD